MLRYIRQLCVAVVFGALMGVSRTWAADWESVLQMDIITRQERGADEVRRRASSFGISSTPSPLSGKTRVIYDYLLTHFADEQALDSVTRYENGHELYRPRGYKSAKDAIIIHHTASDPKRIREQGGVIPHLQHMYKFHTFTRGWGDIGYHFLIDQQGHIYEGRAGGPDVVGAHAKRNNTTTIGISLIGNFQEEYPSQAMLRALTDLSTRIAVYYNIDPNRVIDIHKETSKAPYIQQVRTPAVLGHRDAGNTTCPGDHVYTHLPQLRKDIALGILSASVDGSIQKVRTDIEVQRLSGSTIGTRYSLLLAPKQSEFSGPVSCKWLENHGSIPLEILGCDMDNQGRLSLDVRVQGSYVPGGYPLMLTQGDKSEVRYVRTVWSSALDDLLQSRRKSFAHQLPKSPSPLQKISDHITLDRAREISKGPIRVLLHDASLGQLGDTVSCEHACSLQIQDARTSRNAVGSGSRLLHGVGSMVITEHEGTLGVAIGSELEFFGSSMEIFDSAGGWVSLDTYGRTSYAGLPRNRFQGSLVIQRDEFVDINTGKRKNKYVYINELPFRDYLYGLGEAAIHDPLQKQYVLSLLTKTYAVYYLSDLNKHPSMDTPGHSVSYDAIDDPRAFQKYVGVGWLDVHTEWKEIVDKTRDTRVLYDDYIPILPYFNCSPGMTRSAQKKWGWTDTPRLQSVLDFGVAGCEDFAGHGVGLSGKGATYMAQFNIPYADILRYYYHGIDIRE